MSDVKLGPELVDVSSVLVVEWALLELFAELAEGLLAAALVTVVDTVDVAPALEEVVVVIVGALLLDVTGETVPWVSSLPAQETTRLTLTALAT